MGKIQVSQPIKKSDINKRTDIENETDIKKRHFKHKNKNWGVIKVTIQYNNAAWVLCNLLQKSSVYYEC